MKLYSVSRLNRYPVDATTPEMGLFLSFIKSLHGLHANRTEWMIFGEEERLAGSIDFVATDGAGKLHLFDWKRSKDPCGYTWVVVDGIAT